MAGAGSWADPSGGSGQTGIPALPAGQNFGGTILGKNLYVGASERGGRQVRYYSEEVDQAFTLSNTSLGTGCNFWSGNGVPTTVLVPGAINGDLYFNVAGGSLTTLYQLRSGTWTGIV